MILMKIITSLFYILQLYDFMDRLFNHLFVFFSSLSVTNYFFLCMILVINLPMLCFLPWPVFVWGPPGLLVTGSCCWIVWGLRSLNAAFPSWSCLSYSICFDIITMLSNIKYIYSWYSCLYYAGYISIQLSEICITLNYIQIK
jgi:hypothetical protein